MGERLLLERRLVMHVSPKERHTMLCQRDSKGSIKVGRRGRGGEEHFLCSGFYRKGWLWGSRTDSVTETLSLALWCDRALCDRASYSGLGGVWTLDGLTGAVTDCVKTDRF